jgi:DHA3 family tetracycline resistance protein-like MFS transporter
MHPVVEPPDDGGRPPGGSNGCRANDPTRHGMRRFLAPFASRDFRLLWSASTISLLGDGIWFVAIGWQTLALSNSATALAVVWLAFTLPHIAMLLFGGVISDRLPRRRVLLAANIVSGVFVGAMAVLSLAGVLSVWKLVILVAGYGASEAVFGPAYGAIVPELVDREVLQQANSLNQLNRPVALRLVGPLLGGLLVGAFGTGTAFAFDALTFAVSAAILSRMRVPRTVFEGMETSVRAVLREVGEGLSAVRRVPWLWAGMGADAIGTLATWGCVQALVPIIVRDDLGGSAATLGFVYAAGGVGAVVAAFLTGSRGSLRRPVVVLFLVLAGKVAAVGLFAFATSAATAMLASFVMGSLSTVGLVIWMTLIHERVQGDLLGRVNSIDWLVSTSLMPIALVVVGPLADAFGARALLAVTGFGGALLVLSFLLVPGVLAGEQLRNQPEPT